MKVIGANEITMLVWSDWIIACIMLIIISMIITSCIFIIVRRFVHIDILKKHHDLAGYVIATLGTLYSVLLGFTIVNSQERYGHIISQVNKEAYLCADLFRTSMGLPDEIREEMHQTIKGYLKSVIDTEWALMPEKKENPYTLIKLEELWKPYYSFEPQSEKDKQWFAETLQILLSFNSARLERIYSSWDSLGVLSWTALLGGAVVMIVFLFFFGTENFWSQLLINCLFSGFLAFMLFIVYSLDNPFRPPHAIKPRAYQVVYNYYQTTRGKPISPEDIRTSFKKGDQEILQISPSSF